MQDANSSRTIGPSGLVATTKSRRDVNCSQLWDRAKSTYRARLASYEDRHSRCCVVTRNDRIASRASLGQLQSNEPKAPTDQILKGADARTEETHRNAGARALELRTPSQRWVVIDCATKVSRSSFKECSSKVNTL